MQPTDSPAALDAPRDRAPITELMMLAFPTILQMLAYTVEQFTDAYMLSKVSDLHSTAAIVAGGVVFAIISFGFGVLMLVNALVSQSFGAERHRECGAHLWQGMWFGLIYAVLVVPLTFCAGTAFALLKQPPELVPLQVSYFNVSIALIAVKMLAIAAGQFMLAANRPMVVFWGATVGMLLNVFVNWLLIYGHWGFPAIGVAGAAWGTNAAVAAELVIVCGVAFAPAMRRRFNTLAFRFDRAKFTELLRIGIPSGFQVAGDVVAWNIFLAGVMGVYGTVALAANGYMVQYMKLSFMPAFGLSTAVTALVARYIGAGRPDLGERRAHLAFFVAAAYMFTCGITFWLLGERLMHVFTDDHAVIRMGARLLLFCAVFQFFDAMFIIYNGALRGVKDTFVPACVQIGLCWTLIVGGGLTVANLRPEWGVGGPWTIGCIYCALLGLFLLVRFRTGRWRREASSLAREPEVTMYAAEASR